ncbi:DUF368 domain-containing protein [Pelagicoccus sp. SDUM812003]|uniref:DUF368 domain-containing protein n=1 Tax=Pelagicoccus sp. SDUM812003 TaxID=3041267 RepID=UPI00280DF253|nr:DUF368 domain-containing protein [Pelagicoccus sp. SDUM812003]MDQ8203315.1 DUF368 domain-containing protein [Pelagicoccus sp. SDUM812003]
MVNYLILFLKGVAMGTANVIPGVSGGTIAFVTGIYTEFIDALKSFDVTALKLAMRLEVKALAKHVNLAFLAPLFAGVAISLISLGKLLDWLFNDYPVHVWSFFFGLILASVYYVSKNVKRKGPSSLFFFALGTGLALALAFVKPASENASFFYVAICGVVAVCSMILPGLSGSFVLILMGNYQLVMLQAVPNFDLSIILPFAIGGGIGFIALSHAISFLLHHCHDATLSSLTGFILGSLVVIWPWKSEVYLTDEGGAIVLKEGEHIVQGYDWLAPNFSDATTWIGLGLMLLGILAVILLERTAEAR